MDPRILFSGDLHRGSLRLPQRLGAARLPHPQGERDDPTRSHEESDGVLGSLSWETEGKGPLELWSSCTRSAEQLRTVGVSLLAANSPAISLVVSLVGS